MHGFDDVKRADGVAGNFPDMRAAFMAQGPSFKTGHQHRWIRLVDQYQIFLKALGIQGEQHNGTWENVKDMYVVDDKSNTRQLFSLRFFNILILILTVFALLIYL